MRLSTAGCRCPRLRSEPRGLCQMNSGPVTSALIMTCHVGGGMAEPVLDMRFIDVGRGGEASEQAEPAEERGAIAFWQIGANCRFSVREWTRMATMSRENRTSTGVSYRFHCVCGMGHATLAQIEDHVRRCPVLVETALMRASR